MTRKNARIVVSGLIPDGFDANNLTAQGRQEVRDALDKILELTHETSVVPAFPSPETNAEG